MLDHVPAVSDGAPEARLVLHVPLLPVQVFVTVTGPPPLPPFDVPPPLVPPADLPPVALEPPVELVPPFDDAEPPDPELPPVFFPPEPPFGEVVSLPLSPAEAACAALLLPPPQAATNMAITPVMALAGTVRASNPNQVSLRMSSASSSLHPGFE
jgi:hypothetical protein